MLSGMGPPLPSSARGLPAATGLDVQCTFASVDTPSGEATSVCESCGAPEPEDALVAVHRVYLRTDGEGRVVGEDVLTETERWCRSCRSLYPHKET
jgi:hypothetical protein